MVVGVAMVTKVKRRIRSEEEEEEEAVEWVSLLLVFM